MNRLLAVLWIAAAAAAPAAASTLIREVDPPSNLLPASTTRVLLRFHSVPGAACTADGKPVTPAADAQGYIVPVEGITAARTTEVMLACAGESLRLVYRALPAVALPSRLAPAATSAPGGLPENYYLHDTQGRRIPGPQPAGGWRLNLTRPEVPSIVARIAYDALVAGRLQSDGVFFDTAPPRMSLDADGRRVIPDTDEDGKADFAERLEPDWARGVERAAAEWRKWMPDAYFVVNTLQTAGIADRRTVFGAAWSRLLEPGQPGLCLVAATPPAQIVSGYGERPLEQMPPSTLDFARASYRAMRFGYGLSLLSGCAFQFDLGPAGRAARWSYEEPGFDLGQPLGPAETVTLPGGGGFDPTNRLSNPAFETALEGSGNWSLFTEGAAGVLAFVERDGADKAEGSWSARVTIAEAGNAVPWHVNLYQSNAALRAGLTYDLSFWARADVGRTLGLAAQKSSPDWRNYGLWDTVEIGTAWRRHTVSFIAGESAADAQLQFLLGARKGRVWLDGIVLAEHPPDVLRRRYAKGLVLVNATPQPRAVPAPEDGYRRFAGTQAPRLDSILDDADDAFTAAGGAWERVRIDSGEWEALPPFYHHWGKALRQSADPGATAEWPVSGVEGTLEFSAWWPAAPYRGNWTGSAVYELIRDGVVVASKVVDQSNQGGDQWLPLFTADLSNPQARWRLRVRNQGEGMLTVDAVRMVSAARWNDGAVVTGRVVELAPFDAVLLGR